MLPNQYQELSRRTAPKEMALKNIVMGLVGEGGEIVDLIKKQVFHNHPIDTKFKVNLEKEIGDYFWYLARLIDFGGREFAPPHMSFAYIQKNCAKRVEVAGIEEVALLFGFKNGAIASRVLNEVEVMSSEAYTLMDCICAIAQHYDISIEQAAINNIIKLSQRYPQGFSSGDSIARVDNKQYKNYVVKNNDKPVN